MKFGEDWSKNQPVNFDIQPFRTTPAQVEVCKVYRESSLKKTSKVRPAILKSTRKVRHQAAAGPAPAGPAPRRHGPDQDRGSGAGRPRPPLGGVLVLLEYGVVYFWNTFATEFFVNLEYYNANLSSSSTVD